jgi:hypothetical protein
MPSLHTWSPAVFLVARRAPILSPAGEEHGRLPPGLQQYGVVLFVTSPVHSKIRPDARAPVAARCDLCARTRRVVYAAPLPRPPGTPGHTAAAFIKTRRQLQEVIAIAAEAQRAEEV